MTSNNFRKTSFTYEKSFSARVGGGAGGDGGGPTMVLAVQESFGELGHTASRTSCKRRLSSATLRSRSATVSKILKLNLSTLVDITIQPTQKTIKLDVDIINSRYLLCCCACRCLYSNSVSKVSIFF